MSLLDILRTGVKIANDVTAPIQATVSYERMTSKDEFGKPTYASPVQLKAIVEAKQQQVRANNGIMNTSRASVLFLDITALVAATSGMGIDDEDKITLPDGSTGPILTYDGFVDAGTGKKLYTQVYLG